MKFSVFIFLATMVQFGFAQSEEAFVKKNFVIIQSTKNYNVAQLTANKAALQLKQKLDLRGLKPSKKTGLTFSKADCENAGGYPCYIARGRYDDGDYVSIEWSDEFDKFAKGYYVVIVFSGNKEEAVKTLEKAKSIFKDAYYKQAKVYVGCMH
jgi:hypothetical protein